jgi:hypothetical protein
VIGFPPIRSVCNSFLHCDYRKLHCDYRKLHCDYRKLHCRLGLTTLKSTNRSRVIFLCILLIKISITCWMHSFRTITKNFPNVKFLNEQLILTKILCILYQADSSICAYLSSSVSKTKYMLFCPFCDWQNRQWNRCEHGTIGILSDWIKS